MNKILIGLVGGSADQRAEVADMLVSKSHAQLASWGDGEHFDDDTRDERLATVLDGFERLPGGGLIVTNVRTAKEARRMRAAGGQLWHMMGRHPSALVAIRPGEPLVSLYYSEAHPHWLEPIEALSALQLSRRPQPARAEV